MRTRAARFLGVAVVVVTTVLCLVLLSASHTPPGLVERTWSPAAGAGR